MMVLENESAVRAAQGQIGAEFNLDFAAPRLHFLNGWKLPGNQPGRQRMAVDRER
jgi:hypothetical protein